MRNSLFERRRLVVSYSSSRTAAASGEGSGELGYIFGGVSYKKNKIKNKTATATATATTTTTTTATDASKEKKKKKTTKTTTKRTRGRAGMRGKPIRGRGIAGQQHRFAPKTTKTTTTSSTAATNDASEASRAEQQVALISAARADIIAAAVAGGDNHVLRGRCR